LSIALLDFLKLPQEVPIINKRHHRDSEILESSKDRYYGKQKEREVKIDTYQNLDFARTSLVAQSFMR
jgi:hypothetical protein